MNLMGLKKLFAQSIIWRGFYFFSHFTGKCFFITLSACGKHRQSLFYYSNIFFYTNVLSLSAESGIVYFASGNIIERNKLISLMGLWSVIAGIVMVALIYIFFYLIHLLIKLCFSLIVCMVFFMCADNHLPIIPSPFIIQKKIILFPTFCWGWLILFLL